MAKLRREPPEGQSTLPAPKLLRIVASGTLFLTHTLSLPCHPSPSTVIRAHSVTKTRGGSASTLLSLLAQFPAVEAVLVAPLGGNDEGKMILRDLGDEGIITRYCKVWKGAGVPCAWVLHSADDDSRTVVNHNPLPDITHEEFVSLLGPLLAPENYLYPTPVASPIVSSNPSSSPPSSSQTTPRVSNSGPRPPILTNPNSPAPFDWLHFEGRSVKTTLSNITGLDGLARERKWRSHCVFSVDVGRKGRQGVEALIPHADVLFLNKYYAQANSSHYATTPRSFLLSLTTIAPPHALLVAHWGSEGAAVLSLPTKEYFQSSGWVEERTTAAQNSTSATCGMESGGAGGGKANGEDTAEFQSVRSGSEFWAGGRSRTSSSAFTAGGSNSTSYAHSGTDHSAGSPSRGHGQRNRYSNNTEEDDDGDNDSQGTEVPGGQDDDSAGVVDEVGAQDAFVAGMIYALSRRIAPGSPYTPSSGGEDVCLSSPEAERGRWRLDECLRFATELAGRKARRRNWEGLADEMTRAGWFDAA